MNSDRIPAAVGVTVRMVCAVLPTKAEGSVCTLKSGSDGRILIRTGECLEAKKGGADASV